MIEDRKCFLETIERIQNIHMRQKEGDAKSIIDYTVYREEIER